jgi:Na+/proline symporter
MSYLDWAIILVYLVYVVWDGARRASTTGKMEGYFLADRSLPWWAVGLSVMATQMSAITLVGTTGQAYSFGMSFIQFYYGLPLAMVILCITLVPFFYRARVFTAYEYLERRFDAKTRSLTSFLFLVSRGLSVGVIIAAPAVILSIVLSWSLPATVFMIGLTTTIYTMLGGVKAVTWTDVKQMAIIFSGLAIVLYQIVRRLPGTVTFVGALRIAGAAGRLTTFDTSFDPTNQYTLWSGLIAGLFLMLAYFGTDQSQVQRYLTARSLGQARTSLLMSAFVKIPVQFLILLIGVMVFVFYQFERPPLVFIAGEAARVSTGSQAGKYEEIRRAYDDSLEVRRQAAIRYAQARGESGARVERQAYLDANSEVDRLRRRGLDLIRQSNGNRPINDVNYVFPRFVVDHMPIGVVGLLIAAIMAAAMSAVSAELNSLATATIIDFYRRYWRREGSDRQYVMAGRIATGFWGVFACIVALYSTALGSLIEVVNRFGSFFYGSLLGVFALAILVPRARPRGAFWGLLAGISSVWLVSVYTHIAFLWFNPVGCVVVVVVGYLLSLTVRDVPAQKPTLPQEIP